MSLNCLTCSQVLQRTDSDREYIPEKECKKIRVHHDRSWSGNITPPKCERIRGGAVARIKKEHRRVHSASIVAYPGSPGPRLMRCSGMRRDWSLEDLRTEKHEQRSAQVR